MTSRIPFILIFCVLSSVGCQSLNSMLPWTAKNDGYTLDELTALDSTSTPPSLDQSFTMNDRPSTITQASYTESDGPKDLSSQGSIPQLLSAGKAAIQLGAAGDTGKIAEARRLFESVLDQNRQHTDAHHGAAMASDLQKDWESAVYHYKQALKIRPNDADLLNDLGYSYLLQGRDRDSRTYLQRALEIAPSHKHAVKNLARLSLQQGNASEAQRILATLYPPQDVLQEYSKLAQLISESQPSTAALPDLPKDATPEQVLQRMRQEKERATAIRKQRSLAEAGRTARERTLVQPPPFQPNSSQMNSAATNHSYSMHPPVSTGAGSVASVSAPPLTAPLATVAQPAAQPMTVETQPAAMSRNVAEGVRQPMNTMALPQVAIPLTGGDSGQNNIAIQPAATMQQVQQFAQQPYAQQPPTQQQNTQQPFVQQPQTTEPHREMSVQNNQLAFPFHSPAAVPMQQPVAAEPAAPFAEYQAPVSQSQPVYRTPVGQQSTTSQQLNSASPPLNASNTQAAPFAAAGLPSNVEAQYPVTVSRAKPLGRSVPMQPMNPQRQPSSANVPVPINSESSGNSSFQPGLIQQLMPPANQQPQAANGQRSMTNAELIASMRALGVPQMPSSATNAQPSNGQSQAGTPATANYAVNNGAAYSRPPSVLPAQEYLQQMQQPPQHPSFGPATSGQVPSANTIMPASQSQTGRSADPLDAFEATLQKLDQQYNQAMQQVHGSRLQ